MTWRNFVIRPQYGNRWGMGQSFYAPSLDAAFAEARAQWPNADSWQSVGYDPQG